MCGSFLFVGFVCFCFFIFLCCFCFFMGGGGALFAVVVVCLFRVVVGWKPSCFLLESPHRIFGI